MGRHAFSFLINSDFWWRVQHLVSWQWRCFARSSSCINANSPTMVGITRCYRQHTRVGNCRCEGVVENYLDVIFFGGGEDQHMITLNVLKSWWANFRWLLYRQCGFRAVISSRRECATALYSWLDMKVWVLLCKWAVEQDGNMRLRMPS